MNVSINIVISLTILCSSSSFALAAGEKRTIRVTNGTENLYGWEKPLLKKYGNLNNYYWNPMTRMKYKNIGLANNKKTSKKIANKSLPVIRKKESLYEKPVHRMPGAFAKENCNSRSNLLGKLSTSNTDIKLAVPQTSANILKSYGSYESTDVSASLKFNQNKTGGSTSSTKVSGKLLRK